MIVLGIRGGLAIIGDGVCNNIGMLVDAIDIPTIGDGAKERVDAMEARGWIERHKPDLCLNERAQAMPRQGSSSGFKYGRATGALETIVMLCAIPLEITEPTAWKRHWHLPPKDKERSRQKAIELFSAVHALLARKLDHGRAEAMLIALYGLRNSRVSRRRPGRSPAQT
jgi:crossover junction endodeoxyribonuclease RuvC